MDVLIILLIGLPLLVGLIGLPLLVLLLAVVPRSWAERHWTTTDGQIDAMSISGLSDETEGYWAVALTYSYNASGRVYTTQEISTLHKASLWDHLVGGGAAYTRREVELEAARRFATGMRILVCYDPGAPENSRPMLK